MSDQSLMIEADGLCKYYGRFTAVENITFSIKKGEVVAFLGPNGAGKSTTMKLLTGYMAPSAGVARICGHNMAIEHERRDAANKLGYLPENGPLYQDMSPRALLRFFAETRGISGGDRDNAIDRVVETCQLHTVMNKPISKLSRGYRQRVGMAQSLLHDPDVIVMDEPTSGLDPNQIHEVREAIRTLGQTKTVLLSTHILAEVQAMCSRVVLVDNGRLKYDGSVEDLTKDGTLDDQFRKLTVDAA